MGKWKKTQCAMCVLSCGLEMEVENDRILKDGSMARLSYDITWGDWKHNHMLFERLACFVLQDIGWQVLSHNITETEENGTDCYSGRHDIIIGKPS